MFFNLYAAAESYVSVTITHGTPWHATIHESNGIGKWNFRGVSTRCLQGSREAENLRELKQNLEMLTIKQQAKDLFNFTVLDNII